MYEKIEGTENKYLKFEMFYEKGGMNYWNGGNDKRGYYLSVRIVERKDEGRGFISESFMMFSGIKKLLMEVTRQNKKKLEECITLSKQYEQELKEKQNALLESQKQKEEALQNSQKLTEQCKNVI